MHCDVQFSIRCLFTRQFQSGSTIFQGLLLPATIFWQNTMAWLLIKSKALKFKKDFVTKISHIYITHGRDSNDHKTFKKHADVWLFQRPQTPVCTRHRFDVYTTSITLKRRRLDVKTTLCAYWDTILQHHRLLLACAPSHFLNMSKQHITIIIYIPFSSITMDHKEVSHTPQWH